MFRKLVFLFSLLLLLSACAGRGDIQHPHDPLEVVNRPIYQLNKGIFWVLNPIIKTYHFIVPFPLQQGFRNIFQNLSEPATVANNALQLNFECAAASGWRFLINSTVGLLGMVDVAQHVGLPYRRRNFGSTLVEWGYEESTYLVLPFLGPSTFRDMLAMAMLVDYYTSPYPYIEPDSLDDALKYGRIALGVMSASVYFKQAAKMAPEDEYAAVRAFYLNRVQKLESDEYRCLSGPSEGKPSPIIRFSDF